MPWRYQLDADGRELKSETMFWEDEPPYVPQQRPPTTHGYGNTSVNHTKYAVAAIWLRIFGFVALLVLFMAEPVNIRWQWAVVLAMLIVAYVDLTRRHNTKWVHALLATACGAVLLTLTSYIGGPLN